MYPLLIETWVGVEEIQLFRYYRHILTGSIKLSAEKRQYALSWKSSAVSYITAELYKQAAALYTYVQVVRNSNCHFPMFIFDVRIILCFPCCAYIYKCVCVCAHAFRLNANKNYIRVRCNIHRAGSKRKSTRVHNYVYK